jgi:predicted nucleic acid-binding protein
LIAYVDSSALLRVILGRPDRLAEWPAIDEAVASELIEVECLRTLDRLRVLGKLTDEEVSVRRDAVYRVLDEFHLVGLGRAVLARASHPFPTLLGTLDALHLATALLWRETVRSDLVVATHDTHLAAAARASGLPVVGV